MKLSRAKNTLGAQSTKQLVNTVARSDISCNTCASRAEIYTALSGPNGPLFLEAISTSYGMSTRDAKSIRLRSLAKEICKSEPTGMLAVTNETFPKSASGTDGVIMFNHLNIRPNTVSSPDAYKRFKGLKHYGPKGFDTRLFKLLGTEETASVSMINSVLHELARPNHWKSVVKWVQEIQTYFALLSDGAETFDQLSDSNKWKVRVYAMMNGRVDGRNLLIHLDYQQSDNIVNFIEKATSIEALKNMMDSRSDPSTYMVSSYNRALTSHSVTSDCMIGLTWNGEFTDDLDLHVSDEKESFHCYFGRKQSGGCVLDFDANIRSPEKEPVENISVQPNKEYTFWVVNFTPRTFDKPIPYTIVCREKGKDDVIYEATMVKGFPRNTEHIKFTHNFGSATSQKPVMSLNSRVKNLAHDSEWEEVFGSPISIIASLEDIVPEKILYKLGVSEGNQVTGIPLVSGDANESFKNMLNPSKPTVSKKNLLSERCRELQPSSMTELLNSLNSDSVVEVDYRDFSPGYFVNIKTNQVVYNKDFPIPCHYTDKGSHPVKPVANGNSRFDMSWFTVPPADRRITVKSIIKNGQKYFLVLSGTKLSDSQEFPLGGGFYPTDLKADYHKHRERWTYFHTQLAPIPAEGTPLIGTPLIGTFLVEEKVKLILNGVELDISTN